MTEREAWLWIADEKNWGNSNFGSTWYCCYRGEYIGNGLCTVVRELWRSDMISTSTSLSMRDRIELHRAENRKLYLWDIYTQEGNNMRREFCKKQAESLPR